MTDQEHESSTAKALGRRALLQGTALAGVAAALTACGDESGTSPTAGAGGEASTSPTATPSGTSSSAGSSDTSLANVKDIPVGGGVIVDEVVITQPQEGTVKAFSAVCTHQGCIVDDVSDDVISCPCHGSSYSADDGTVINGPATSPLPEVPIEVKDGKVLPA